MQIFFVNFWMGHKLNDSQITYYKANPNELRDIYQKYIPFLTIQKELVISESEDFKRIKQEHATLLTEAERHRVERSELKALREEIEKLKQSAI
jgi:hypothetical protein